VEQVRQYGRLLWLDKMRIVIITCGSATWRHEDREDPQSVTADDGSFDSHPECSGGIPDRCMQGGETFTHVFAEVGRFPYHSRTEEMAGV
jgi:hypothetical protein